MHRRGFLAGIGATIATGLTARSGSATAAARSRSSATATADTAASIRDDPSLPESVGLEPLTTELELPVDAAFAPDGDRRYVAQRGGLARVLESGDLLDEPFLDLTADVEPGPENGLLGLALHPDFAENRRAFVRYSAPPREGTPSDFTHAFVLSEFAVTADGRRIDRDSERPILEIPEPGAHHNAGDIAFGPDGYLYVGVGDGGGGVGDSGKGTVSDWYIGVDGGNGQDVTENLLGSVLRIDVDDRADGEPYSVPSDNPLVGRSGLDEQYAWGFRNPWRMSFDGGDLYVADVGRIGYEEVNLVEKGGNYGWNVKEGTHCHEAADCPDETPVTARGGEPLIDPIVEYPHARIDAGAPVNGNAVIGGYVYRGDELPALRGVYVFADLDAGGDLFAATRPDGDGLWPTQVVEVVGGDALRRVFSFGRDGDGELYVLGEGDGSGGLYRIVSGDA